MSIIYAKYQGTCNIDGVIGYEGAKKFINNWDAWEKCFPTETLLWLVNERITRQDVCAIHYTPVSYGQQGYLAKEYEVLAEIKRNVHFVEEKGGWYKDHYEDAYQYVVPKRYQSVYLRKPFEEAIYRSYPYMKKYKFDAYIPDYGANTHDIYIYMTYKLNGEEVKTHLYCPLEALLQKNPDMITQRHYGYNSDYYKRQPERAKVILGVLNSQKYKAFCKKVKEG